MIPPLRMRARQRFTDSITDGMHVCLYACMYTRTHERQVILSDWMHVVTCDMAWRAMGVHGRASDMYAGRTAGLYKKLEIWKQFYKMDTPHARFKSFPIACACVKWIYNPIPPIVQLCWIMLVYVEFMLV